MSRIFACDFETTVFEGQDYTEVWAAALIELYTEEPMVYHCIGDMFDYIFSLKANCVLYFHNLKFDGSFILPYLIKRRNFEQAFDKDGKAIPKSKMRSGSLNYVISDMGQWYVIYVKYGTYTIEIRDSLKLMPMALKKLGKDFKTKHQKLD